MAELPNLIVAGRRGSGKSVFTEYVSKKHGYEILRFSETLRIVAQEKGLIKSEDEFNRKMSQDLGLQLKKENGMDFLAVKTIERMEVGKKYILDGARELDEVKTMKEKVNNVLLVYVDSDFDTRFQRVNKRDGWSLEEFTATEQHPIEANIEKLKDVADYVIVNNFLIDDEFHRAIDFFFQNI